MKRAILLLLLVVLVACNGSRYTLTGWVRSSYSDGYRVTFETEDARIYDFHFCGGEYAPPLWVGMHARIEVERQNMCGDLFISVVHLPPDAGHK